MKKLFALIAVLVIAGAASSLFAADEDEIELLVTPTVNTSILITYGASYNFGSVDLGATTVNSSAITIQNDGDCSATWDKKATSHAGGDGSSYAIVSDIVQLDQVRMRARCVASGADAPAHSDFVAGDDISAAYGNDLTGATDVGAGVVKDLYIRLEMPTATDTSTTKTFTLTVTATAL